ncbi:hypothetical protein [Leptospira weilii]|nr:hypothetical protein [Leptospira weilii]
MPAVGNILSPAPQTDMPMDESMMYPEESADYGQDYQQYYPDGSY